MDITLINPPEKMRVWAGIQKAQAHGVYVFLLLGCSTSKPLSRRVLRGKRDLRSGLGRPGLP